MPFRRKKIIKRKYVTVKSKHILKTIYNDLMLIRLRDKISVKSSKIKEIIK